MPPQRLGGDGDETVKSIASVGAAATCFGTYALFGHPSLGTPSDWSSHLSHLLIQTYSYVDLVGCGFL